jgi:hypothetical protein
MDPQLTLQTSKLLHDLCAAARLQMLEASDNACPDSMSAEDQEKKKEMKKKPAASLAMVEGDRILPKQGGGGGSEAVSCIHGMDQAATAEDKKVKKKTVRCAEPLVMKKQARFAEPIAIQYEYDPEDIDTVAVQEDSAEEEEEEEEEEEDFGLQDHEATQQSLAGSEALRLGAALAAILLEKKEKKNLKINSSELACRFHGNIMNSLNLRADWRFSKFISARVIKVEGLKEKLKKQSKKLCAMFRCHRA